MRRLLAINVKASAPHACYRSLPPKAAGGWSLAAVVPALLVRAVPVPLAGIDSHFKIILLYARRWLGGILWKAE